MYSKGEFNVTLKAQPARCFHSLSEATLVNLHPYKVSKRTISEYKPNHEVRGTSSTTQRLGCIKAQTWPRSQPLQFI